ncbi:MAG: glucans biosynthesis glucosyltransferase MdoH [Rhodospirillales bacterium]|nr:glucans biosynthesis glucosyltransferase MdoH [Rhodospirillales bacterium]
MAWRRALVGVIATLAVIGLGALLWQVLAPGGWTWAKGLMAAGFAGAAPWLGLCAANGLIGAALAGSRPRGAAAAGPLPRCAIVVTVRNEDMGAVLPPLLRLLDGLAALGAGDAFAAWILSDTTDPALAETERRAVAAEPRLRYRRRDDNAGFKAGNLMDFLDHHAGDATVMVVLDADSEMTPAAVLRLVRTLQATPQLAIVQHLTVGLPAAAGFPRLFQFGMRAGMRSWARALAWWQGDEACYWGHNAAIRIAPFRQHARLSPLPDGSTILSHDQIEAAQLAGAGWGVRLLPEEEGSFEANPPALPEFIRRELRWLGGNFQYGPLLRHPGLRPMGRWQLVQAMLLFGSTPFYLVFLAGAALAAATDRQSAFPAGWALALAAAWLCVLYAPKWLSYAGVLGSRRERARYGGGRRVLAGIAAETLFTLLLDPITTVAKTIGTARLALGATAGWAPQNRSARGVRWGEALRLLWPQTLIGAAALAAFAQASWGAVLWALPFVGGLVVAVPFCVVTASPGFGRWLRVRGVAAVPEEIGGR